MCPSYMATRDENDSTRGRANVLRLAISGQLGPIGLTDPALYPVLDLCLECKACKSECPTGVDMARMKSEFLHQYRLRHGTKARSRLLAHVDQLAVWGSRLAPAVELARRRAFRCAGWPTCCWVSTAAACRRRLPAGRFSIGGQRKRGRFEHGDGAGRSAAGAVRRHLHELSRAGHSDRRGRAGRSRGLGRLGSAARLLRPAADLEGISGRRPAAGRADRASAAAAGRAGLPIVFCEPGCYSAVRDDHPQLAPRRAAGATRVALPQPA